MNNSNVRVAIYVRKKLKKGTAEFEAELKKKVQQHLAEMERAFSEAEFAGQVANLERAMLTMAGVDFLLFFS